MTITTVLSIYAMQALFRFCIYLPLFGAPPAVRGRSKCWTLARLPEDGWFDRLPSRDEKEGALRRTGSLLKKNI